MFHIYLKEVMDSRSIKGADLASALGCSRNNISEIRSGKTNPSIDRFWEILMVMEKLSPGSMRHFADLMAERAVSFVDLKVSKALKQKRENNAKVEPFLTAS